MLHKSIKVLVEAYWPEPMLNNAHVYLQWVGLTMIKECSSTCKALLLLSHLKKIIILGDLIVYV